MKKCNLHNKTINVFYQKETKNVIQFSKSKLFKYHLYIVCIYGFNIWLFTPTKKRNLI